MQNRENVKYTLLIFFIHGEAAAPHLCDLADDEEAVRVDGVDQLFRGSSRLEMTLSSTALGSWV